MTISIVLSIVAIVLSFFTYIVHFGRLKAAFDALKQNARSNKKSSELLALLELQKLSSKVELAGGMELITSLSADNWDDFQKIPAEEKEVIRTTVAHLNFVATLVFSEHLDWQTAWNTYFQPYRLAGQKLDPWWFDGMADQFPSRYISARRMMGYVLSIRSDEIAKFDKIRTLELEKRFSAVRNANAI